MAVKRNCSWWTEKAALNSQRLKSAWTNSDTSPPRVLLLHCTLKVYLLLLSMTFENFESRLLSMSSSTDTLIISAAFSAL